MAQILWIEDEATKLKGLVRPLERSGDVVTFALSKREAFALCESNHYDLIILDLIIPSGSDEPTRNQIPNVQDFEGEEYEGVKFLCELRASGKGGIPILVLSVVDDEETLDEVKAMGVNKVLRKGSYLPSDLKIEVDSLLKRREGDGGLVK